MNTENETPLEQWIEETKKKNLSLKDLENYIRNSLSCPYGTVFSQLPGLDFQDKAEILFNEWKAQPKPIEKWSIRSYVVFLKNVGNTKAGHIDVITKIIDVMSVYLEKYLTLSISRESKGEIKWFATEAEAEVFAETLISDKVKNKFTVGTWYKLNNWISKFHHLEENYKFYGENINTYTGYLDPLGWLSLSDYTPIALSIEEVQQYLPDGHPDKIKPNQKFEVGDWVVWKYGYIDTIKRHCNSYSDSWYLSERYNSCSELALRHATQEEINNHLISIGQIPADEPLNTDSLKMILSIDNEELPMVSIIKTNTVKQLLNLE